MCAMMHRTFNRWTESDNTLVNQSYDVTFAVRGVTDWLEALGVGPHFEFTEEFIIIKVQTKITIKHKTMMKCEVKSNNVSKKWNIKIYNNNF